MSQQEVADILGLDRKRVWQIEASALAKIHCLWAGEELDQGLITDRRELQRLVAQCRNALQRIPKMPKDVTT